MRDLTRRAFAYPDELGAILILTVLDGVGSKPDDGGFQSIEQIANWVRFADARATVLTAGLGVVLTMLMSSSEIVAAAMRMGRGPALVVGSFTPLTLLFLWTLFSLVRGIAPQGKVTHSELNRFAWPSLRRSTVDSLMLVYS